MLGPVLRFELITTARRGRYYWMRAAYGLFMLFTLWTSFESQTAFYSGRINSPHDMAVFAESIFSSIGWFQWCAMLVIVPAMTAGVIADAHRRKTLRDLLSSGITARGIVFGKLTARLGHVAGLVAVGVPIVALIGLFGGLDPWIVLDVYAGTASIAVAVGGVSILASTLARRPREAIVTAYGLELAWLILPPMMSSLLPYMAWPLPLLNPLNQFLVRTNPFWVATRLSSQYYWPRNAAMMPWIKNMMNEMHLAVAMMVALQLVLGLFSAGLAAFLIRRLRSGDREGTVARTWLEMIRTHKFHKKKPTFSTMIRPEIGEDPMIWKEWYAAPRGGFAWLVSGPVALFLGVLLGCFLFEIGSDSFREMWYAGQPYIGRGRTELNGFVRMTLNCMMMAWLVAVASAGSVAITSEREDDTWISLTSSLLSGREVIRGKILGAVWGTRKFVYTMLATLAVAVIAGGVHPLGAIFTLSGIVVFGIFTASLGVWCSLRMSNSTRSLVCTIILLLVVNFGLVFLLAGYESLAGHYRTGPPNPWFSVTILPMLEYISLFNSEQIAAILRGDSVPLMNSPADFSRIILPLLIVCQLTYGLGALALWASSIAAYDRVVGRAFRNHTAGYRRKREEVTS